MLHTLSKLIMSNIGKAKVDVVLKKCALTLNGVHLETKAHWILYAQNLMIVLIEHHFCRVVIRMSKIALLISNLMPTSPIKKIS